MRRALVLVDAHIWPVDGLLAGVLVALVFRGADRIDDGGAALTIAVAIAAALFAEIGVERDRRRKVQADRERQRAHLALEAEAAPIRLGAMRHVAQAASRLTHERFVYRDIAAGQPRQTRISILEITRGQDPEGQWNMIETPAIQREFERLGRQYAADIGAPLGELGLDVRGHAHAITGQLVEAGDALDRVTMAANNVVSAEFGMGAERDRAAKERSDAVAELRTYLRAVVIHAEELARLEQGALGEVSDRREEGSS